MIKKVCTLAIFDNWMGAEGSESALLAERMVMSLGTPNPMKVPGGACMFFRGWAETFRVAQRT
jgi:hypothetical protein